jgi:hypothetical protein
VIASTVLPVLPGYYTELPIKIFFKRTIWGGKGIGICLKLGNSGEVFFGWRALRFGVWFGMYFIKEK